jgi:protein-disulfide isomerase
MTRFYVVLGVVALVGVAAVGYSVSSKAMGTAVAEPVDLDIPDLGTLVSLAKGVERGNPDAPVTILEFADYQCPACGQYAMMIKPQVDLQLVESGRAKYVFYDFPLVQSHPGAFLAARAARCAGEQDAYWTYHDELFRQQNRWTAERSPAGLFVDYAVSLGLDEDEFGSCLRSDRYADVITANLELGRQLGVSGTPTFMVSSGQGMATRLPDWYFDSFESAVAEAEGR